MDFFRENIIPGEVIVQLVAFLIVFFTLKAMAWKPILNALNARREKIKRGFDDIEEGKGEIEKLKSEYQAHLQKIEEESRARIQEAMNEGQKISRDIQEKARADAQATFDKQKENLSLEVAKARIQLRHEVADLTVKVAEKVVQSELTEGKQQKKILDMIEELETVQAKGGKKL